MPTLSKDLRSTLSRVTLRVRPPPALAAAERALSLAWPAALPLGSGMRPAWPALWRPLLAVPSTLPVLVSSPVASF